MNAITALITANVALWLGLGLYVAFLLTKQANLEKRIKQLEIHNG